MAGGPGEAAPEPKCGSLDFIPSSVQREASDLAAWGPELEEIIGGKYAIT